MEEVTFVSLAVGRCVDACCLLLDFLIRTYSWLLRFLSVMGGSLHGTLMVLSGSSLVEYWNFAIFSFLTATEAMSRAACGALHIMEGFLESLGGVFESFKMVGHLSCHLLWRTKEVLHSWMISGNGVLRQTCEGVCIALSLALYFVNTVVNIVLIGTQNCLSVLAGVWEVVADPVHRVAELALTALTFLYSCLVGASVLLWTPCQLLLDCLGALGHIFVTIFMVDSNGLLITAAVVSLALLLLNPRRPALAGQLGLRLVNFVLGARGIQTDIHRAHVVVPEQALAYQEVHARIAQEASGTDAGSLIAEADLPVNEPRRSDPPQILDQGDGEAAREGDGSSPTDGELFSLLKEQEERRKCVICQDLSKTVLLLPCRHLCLCHHCTDILTQQRPVQQRCCPLCRQPITQTMDVFL